MNEFITGSLMRLFPCNTDVVIVTHSSCSVKEQEFIKSGLLMKHFS